MPLELPQAVPMGASGCWGHWLTAGAQVQLLLPQGLGREGTMSHGLVFPEPGSATVWHESLTPRQNSARCTWHHPAQTSCDHAVHMGACVARSCPEAKTGKLPAPWLFHLSSARAGMQKLWLRTPWLWGGLVLPTPFPEPSHCSAGICSPRSQTDLGVSVPSAPGLCPGGLLSSLVPHSCPKWHFSLPVSHVVLLQYSPGHDLRGSPVPACRSAVIQPGSEHLRLLPVPSCVYPRQHFCLLASESPRSGLPSPACCEQEGEWEERRSVGSLPPALGAGAVQCNTRVLQEKKNQVRMESLAALVHLARRSGGCQPRSREQPSLPCAGCMGCGSSQARWLLLCWCFRQAGTRPRQRGRHRVTH